MKRKYSPVAYLWIGIIPPIAMADNEKELSVIVIALGALVDCMLGGHD